MLITSKLLRQFGWFLDKTAKVSLVAQEKSYFSRFLIDSQILPESDFAGENKTYLRLIQRQSQAMHFTERDKLCIPVPLYHCFGMVLGSLLCVSKGAAAIYPSDSFDPKTTLEVVQQEKCTGLHGVPTMFISELELNNFIYVPHAIVERITLLIAKSLMISWQR